MISAILHSYLDFWTEVFNISGRTKRFDFWVPFIINLLIFSSISMALKDWNQTVAAVVGIIYFIANITIIVRRIRDAGHSGWLVLLGLIPVIGQIILLLFCLQKSK